MLTARTFELVDLDWQRIQLAVRLRAGTDTALGSASIGLRHDSSGERMPATHVEAVGAELLVRFNVMQGPGQRPLAPGRWDLVVEDDAVPVTTALPDSAENPRSFRIRGVEFRATPRLDATTGRLTLEVEVQPFHDPAIPPRPWIRRVAGRVKRWIRKVRPALFEVLFRVCRAVARRNGRRILFTSDSRAELGGNLKIVYDRMVERGLDREYELQTLFKLRVTARRSFRDRLRLPWLLGRTDVIVIDDYQPVIYRVHDPDVRIVQLWHAVGSFKTVGYSRVGKPGAPNPYSNIHKNYTYAIVSARNDVQFYAEAFGIPEERVVPTGIPRVDVFLDRLRQGGLRGPMERAYPETRGRRTILFAPTFRGRGAKSATYDFDSIDFAALFDVCVERDAVCIVRMHPFVREPLVIPPGFRDRIVDGSRSSLDVNELLYGIDLLITDYSSIVYEYSILGRPMLFYAYDLEDYVGSRDFYEPYETFVPGRIVRTFAELVDAIRNESYELEKVAPFAARHFEHLDGRSTDRVIDLIVGR
ncbi:MAG: CDP-glycerol glycerophosphotransferase family protein [Chloroflexota bacterium]